MTTINGNYREFKLDNGLSVALQETPTQTVAGRLRVLHGALNEKKGEEGLAHFLEHTLVNGGSKKYSPEKANEIMDKFGFFNAYTGLEKTFFPVDMLSEDTPSYLECISDAAFNPSLEASKVEQERQRVLREIADDKSNPAFKDNKAYLEAFFGKGSPHIYSVLGDEEIISSASREDLNSFYKRGYHPNNMDLILVGALPKNIEKLVQETFGNFPVGNGKRIKFPRNPKLTSSKIFHTYAPELLNQENPNSSSAHLRISLVAPTDADEDSYATDMLAKILGGQGNSRLFENVSQKKGLAYGIGAGYHGTNNQGRITIGGSIHALRANEAIDANFEEMAKLRTDLVSQESLEKLKRDSQYRIAKTFETNSGHVNAIEWKMDEGLTPEYHMKKMNEVTPEKIREAAIKYLPQSREEGKYVLSLRDPLKK